MTDTKEPSVAELVEWIEANFTGTPEYSVDKPMMQIAAALTRLERRCAEMEKALKELCELKSLKRDHGETASYLARKPAAWRAAYAAIALPPERANEEIETP